MRGELEIASSMDGFCVRVDGKPDNGFYQFLSDLFAQMMVAGILKKFLEPLFLQQLLLLLKR